MSRFLSAVVLLAASGIAAAQAPTAVPDARFANGGLAEFDADPPGVMADTDDFVFGLGRSGNGYLVFIGWDDPLTQRFEYDLLVRRLRADGSIDTGYGNAGRADFTVRLANVGDATVDAEGRALICGEKRSSPDDASTAASVLVRVTRTGQADLSFGISGGATGFNAAGLLDRPNALAVDTAGRILMAGTVARNPNDASWYVVRFTPNGLPDTTFGTGGGVRIDFDLGPSLFDTLVDIALAPDGRIWLVGGADSGPENGRLAVARLTPQGQLDETFCSTAQCIAESPAGLSRGKRVFELEYGGYDPDRAVGLAATVDALGGLLVGGADARVVIGREQPAFLARIGADGRLDGAFGDSIGSGVATVRIDDARAAVESVGIDREGRILVGGASDRELGGFGRLTAFVARFTVSGQPDPLFAPNLQPLMEYDAGTPDGTFLGSQLHDEDRVLFAGANASNGGDGIVLALGHLDRVFGGPDASFE
jgi:uncharacterized delta-60 repeat protein